MLAIVTNTMNALTTQRLHVGVHNSTGHTLGVHNQPRMQDGANASPYTIRYPAVNTPARRKIKVDCHDFERPQHNISHTQVQ